MISEYITDSKEAIAEIALPYEKNVWIHGSITYISTGSDYTPPVVLPQPE